MSGFTSQGEQLELEFVEFAKYRFGGIFGMPRQAFVQCANNKTAGPRWAQLFAVKLLNCRYCRFAFATANHLCAYAIMNPNTA